MPYVYVGNYPISPVNIGDIAQGVATQFIITLVDIGDPGGLPLGVQYVETGTAEVTLESPASDFVAPDFYNVDGTYASPTDFTFEVTAGTLGAFTTTIHFNYNGLFPNLPYDTYIVINATVVTSVTKALSCSPAALNFPDTKDGETSAEQLITVQNTSLVTVTVSAYSFPTGFAVGATDPALPQAILAGGSYQFGIVFEPNASGLFSDIVEVQSDAAASPFEIAVSGIGFPIEAAFIVTGAPSCLIGTATTVLLMDSEDLSTDDCFATKDIGVDPGYEYSMIRVQVNYEDKGVASLTLTAVNRRGQTSSQTVAIGTVAADDQILAALLDLAIEGEIVRLTLTTDGPFSMTSYILNAEGRGEVKKA